MHTWVDSIDVPPSALLTLVILGLQSAHWQFSKEDVSEAVHLPSTRFSLYSGSLFEFVTEPTNSNSHSPLIARDSFSEMMMSSMPSRSTPLRDNSDSNL